MMVVAVRLHAADNTIVVKDGDAESLLQAIEQANRQNADSTAERLFILLPDGLYDLGERVLTTITGHNVSLIGQSMNGTIIRNAPDAANEGISKTATIRVMATGTYLQDLTLQNALKYYECGSAGRAVTLHEKQSTRTICNRVRLLSYQDTYYSDSEEGQFYFLDSEIHGTIDFICGAGDVFFSRCTIVTERRAIEDKGRCVIAAPRTSKTQFGYVFDGCTIKNLGSAFHYARGWHTSPRCAFLNTTLEHPELLLDTRFDYRGMRTVNSQFYEYHTMDASGKDITPKSNIVTFTLKEEKNTVETIMAKEKARDFRLKNVFPDWRPDKQLKNLQRQAERLKKTFL